MLLGIGFWMAFGQHYRLSPLVFMLIATVIGWQFYVLMYGFWFRVFSGFGEIGLHIYLDMDMLLRASRCTLGILIGLCAVNGRLSMRDMLKLLPLFVFGYTMS